MMQLTQPEIIQILRRRRGMNQSELGVRAFKTTPDSGRTKIKNIELGKQVPTYPDLKKLAAVLGVGVRDLLEERTGQAVEPTVDRTLPAVGLHPKVSQRFPGLVDYMNVLNKAVVLDDDELVAYTCRKIAGLLTGGADFGVSEQISPVVCNQS